MTNRMLVALLVALSVVASACSGGEAARKAQNGPQDKLTSSSDETAKAAAEAQTPVADSDIIPVGDSAVLGPNDAPVTIVAFSDFQCPFCSRGAATVDELLEDEDYKGQVRVVFKHYPLPFHRQAKDASRAAMAAGEQGRFWQMHDLLFDNQSEFRGKDTAQMKELTAGWAEKLGLDVDKFKADFDKPAYQEQIDQDAELVSKLGVRGTPNFFVNGVNIRGAQPLARFQEVVDAQLEQAKEQKEQGVASDQMYRTLVQANYETVEERAEPEAKPPEPTQIVEQVPVHKDDAVKGSNKALVTIVEFSDFQCPFCGRTQSTLDKVSDKYGDKVRLVFKHLPLPFHQQADEAAKLAMAAQKKGKFWQMHDLLFDNQRRLGEEGIFVELGKEVGLSEREVERALESDAYQKRLDRDAELAKDVGARGTPTFYVNGVQLMGAQPYASFEALIDEQLEIAEKIAEEKKLSGDKLYDAAIAYNKEHAPAGEDADQPSADEPAPRVDTSKLSVDKDQVKGPQDAKVTVFVFSDFQCPYCRTGAQHFDQALDEFDDEVKVIFKHYPLPFHDQAEPAAKAAMAAGEQGKFWQMHDLLFKNQRRLNEDGVYAELAKELGLDVDKFKNDMKNDAFDKQIAADMKQADALGVRGTPAYFIDGTRVIGAQPVETFEDAIEEALTEKQ